LDGKGKGHEGEWKIKTEKFCQKRPEKAEFYGNVTGFISNLAG